MILDQNFLSKNNINWYISPFCLILGQPARRILQETEKAPRFSSGWRTWRNMARPFGCFASSAQECSWFYTVDRRMLIFILFASLLSIGNMSVTNSNFWAGIHVFLFKRVQSSSTAEEVWALDKLTLYSPYIDFYKVHFSWMLMLCKTSNPHLLVRVVAVVTHMILECIVFCKVLAVKSYTLHFYTTCYIVLMLIVDRWSVKIEIRTRAIA